MSYVHFQLAKAFTTVVTHEDAATRERALAKIAQWANVMGGILDGSIQVGSRTPLRHVPGWATPEVVTGGFVTGALLAGGPLREHEEALRVRLPSVPGLGERRNLNGYYLTDEGLAQLERMLLTGSYEVEVPEEGALLVVAWLVRSGYAEEARALLEELAPHFAALRFYPIPREEPRRFGSRVFLQNVGSTMESLRRIRPNHLFLAQKEAIHVWIPLYDQIAALFLETVEGEPPILRCGPDGSPLRNEKGSFQVEGGWPCQHRPEGWSLRAQTLLEQFAAERLAHRLCGKPDRAKGNVAQLREYLRRYVEDPGSLSGRDVGRIRLLLAGYVTKHGTPGSERLREQRARQVKATSAPSTLDIAKVLLQRLAAYPGEAGIDDLDAVTQPVSAKEGAEWQVHAGTAIPQSLQKKVQRSVTASVEELVERGVISSGETLARILPQITAELRAAGFSSDAPRRLYAAIYRAFRRRRSLLLLNLESQIKIGELPWVAAMDRHRQDTLSTQELAKQTLLETVLLSLRSFPHAILPNKLLQELRALTLGAGLDLPLVDEVAADIFMGQFSDKFVHAAKRAADLLEGSLYATYYGIDYNLVKQLPVDTRGRGSRPYRATSDPFAALCRARAGVTDGMPWHPAVNGMIIEQQQILTTQNLAVLFAGLNLKVELGHRTGELARQSFAWICRRLQMKADQWHARLIMIKNSAYAWRQMLFYLSMLPASDVQAFLAWAEEHLSQQKDDFRTRFLPAFQGLKLAAAGHSPDDPSIGPAGAKLFLGYSRQRHWLIQN